MPDTTPLKNKLTNLILSALPAAEYERIFPEFELAALHYGENIYECGEDISCVYFPNSGVVSLLAAVKSKATLEVGLVGNEGMVGLAYFLGVKTSNIRAVVQGQGFALKMKAADFLTECRKNTLLTRLILRFTHSLLAQVSQSAACYRFHPVEARLARWLLMTSDRMHSHEFKVTQEFLSNMLGVRREAVNKAAVILQQEHLISYSRGNVTITDHQGLKKVSCECYAVIKAEEKSFPVV